ncbi:hypothetical protein EOA27_14120 [Mesorhizobium sp. M2A.F.Ca.ET.037.01.1.1]|uniref:hypothetical protein n=1 Tax=unclassified Mesorhizobium TaxID=325217 RepID=UPI000FCCA8D7|nr:MULTISPECIES: hypothetical protein [unclassified Mesorhizobium]RUX18030.1 hypothetical protein EOA27_14120 [Mesorhizobium sp. M2A.F.Ca.ET.037.01.1.1]RUY09521.1 hypothetical protein EOA25_11110 [Mesorhizobium sp. M2A.F.Ca.ET.040.01.1.1]RWA93741.1 MAG: hypothetical protein EOQ31_01200 [Mesorhizobium sp.]TIV14276.1 MAG: hypothetical protein E5V95_30990 [Mesorhizobium sp.]
MNEAANIAAFGTALQAAFDRFKMEEAIIRARAAQAVEAGKAPRGLAVDDMLERPTRRFLIDPMLRELGWDPGNPGQVTEEARSWAENGDRLYFDYLGLDGQRAPTLLVEAKGADAKTVRPPRGVEVAGRRMAVLVSEALGSLKADAAPSSVLAQWATWLNDLRIYVRSLGVIERKTLQRVVITAGRWLIIFADPISAFVDDGVPASDAIHCYVSLEEIVDAHQEIYRLLARSRLINTLPLTLTLREALGVLSASALMETYRGVVVATRMSGGMRSEYPTRAVYPAVVLLSGGSAWGVVDYNAQPLEEPRDAKLLGEFLSLLANRGDAFEQSVVAAFGRQDLVPSPLAAYPLNVRDPDVEDAFAPASGSTAAMIAATAPLLPQFVRRTKERGANHEFLVITGQTWFYKTAAAFGMPCDFHSFPMARKQGAAGTRGHFERAADTFTVSGDDQHCEHDPLGGLRSSRCHLSPIELHLCCRACVFHDRCWREEDLPRLPCAT